MFNLTYCHGDNSRRNSNRNMTTKTALFPGNSVKRSSRPEVFCKKVLSEISQNSQENTCARVSDVQVY